MLIALIGCGSPEDAGSLSQSFDRGTATSWRDNDTIFTEVTDHQDMVVASAVWDVPARVGVVEDANQSMQVSLDPRDELTLGVANEFTYLTWSGSDSLVPYLDPGDPNWAPPEDGGGGGGGGSSCTRVAVQEDCYSCYYTLCTYCVRLSSGYYCSVHATEVTCPAGPPGSSCA